MPSSPRRRECCDRAGAWPCWKWPHPNARILRVGHGVYFNRVVPLVGGLLSNRDAYRYLPRSVDYLPDTTDLLTRLAAPGFQQVQRSLLGGGAAQLLTATRSRP